MKRFEKLFPIICGFLVGLINGLLGAGGGMLAVPLLRKLGLSQCDAHANSVAVILPLSAISASIYMFSRRVSFRDALIYMPAGIIGAILGAKFLQKIPNIWLRRIFGAFMIWAGIRLIGK